MKVGRKVRRGKTFKTAPRTSEPRRMRRQYEAPGVAKEKLAGKDVTGVLKGAGRKVPKKAADRLEEARNVIMGRSAPRTTPGGRKLAGRTVVGQASAGGRTFKVAQPRVFKTGKAAKEFLAKNGVSQSALRNMSAEQAIKTARNRTQALMKQKAGTLPKRPPRAPRPAKAAAQPAPKTPRKTPQGRALRPMSSVGKGRTFKVAAPRTFKSGAEARRFLEANGLSATQLGKMSADQLKRVASNLSRAKRMAKEGRLPTRPAPQRSARKAAQKGTKKATQKPAQAAKSKAAEPAKKATGTKKAAEPKVSARAQYEAKVNAMKPAKLKAELKKARPDVTYRNPEQARTLLMKSFSKKQRAAKGKKGTPRTERRGAEGVKTGKSAREYLAGKVDLPRGLNADQVKQVAQTYATKGKKAAKAKADELAAVNKGGTAKRATTRKRATKQADKPKAETKASGGKVNTTKAGNALERGLANVTTERRLTNLLKKHESAIGELSGQGRADFNKLVASIQRNLKGSISADDKDAIEIAASKIGNLLRGLK